MALMVKNILAKRYGFLSPAKFYTLDETRKGLGITKERVRQLSLQALKRLRHHKVRDKLRGMHHSITAVADELLEDRLVLTPEELKTALLSRGLLNAEDDAYFLPMMHLFAGVFPGQFTYIDMKSGRIARDVTQPNIWLVKDRHVYLEILPRFCGQEQGAKKPEKILWSFEEYQEMLYEKCHILVSIQELRRIFEAHSGIAVLGDMFSTSDKSKRTFPLVSAMIKEKGALHYEEIAAYLGKNPSSTNSFLHFHPQFVLVGNGIFDLLELHPEQRDIPYPKGKRKAPVFGAVYGILREAKGRLTPEGIHRRMQERGYKWALHAVKRVLKYDEKHRIFFEEKNGRYGIKLNP